MFVQVQLARSAFSVSVFLAAVLLVGCDSGASESDEVEVRVQNQSGSALDSVQVLLGTPDDLNARTRLNFSGLLEGETSPYKKLPSSSSSSEVYDYDYAIIFGSRPVESYRFGPLLPDGFDPGKYTFSLEYERFSCAHLTLDAAVREESGSEAVEVRMRNLGSRAFDQVAGGFPTEEQPAGVGQRIEFGAVDSNGGASAYREVERAYRYAYAQVVAGADTLEYEPIDYVGEDLLPPGKYTYDLRAGERTCLEDQTELVRE